MKVEDLMTTTVVTVRPGTPLKEVARILVAEQISGLPVVDGNGAVVGVVAESDLIAKETGTPLPVRRGRLPWRRHREGVPKFHGKVAGDVMTSPAITMEPYRSVAAAAQMMLDGRIHRLPIVGYGQLVGIVTASDLVRAFARGDEEIAHDLRDEMRYRLDIAGDPGEIDVQIDEAAVSLHGTVRRRSTISDLEEAAAAVPGVIEVRSELGWLDDDLKPTRNAGRHEYW
jgi:CBS domain-containing protein